MTPPPDYPLTECSIVGGGSIRLTLPVSGFNTRLLFPRVYCVPPFVTAQ